jgi:hypothetical protein
VGVGVRVRVRVRVGVRVRVRVLPAVCAHCLYMSLRVILIITINKTIYLSIILIHIINCYIIIIRARAEPLHGRYAAGT